MEDKYYYTIFMKRIGFPHYDIDLSEDEDCFVFDTEQEANVCLKLIFNNGEITYDEQYGRVRYYVGRVKEKRCNIYDDIGIIFDSID